MSGRDQKEWLQRLDREYANLRRGLQISLDTANPLGARLGYGLSRYWEIRGHIREGHDWSSALLAQIEPTEKTLSRARLLDIDGWFQHIMGNSEQARALLEESLEIFLQQGEHVHASITLIRLGFAAQNQGDIARARALFEESLALRRELGDPRLIAIVLINLGNLMGESSEFTQARLLLEEALVLLTDVGDRRIEANCLTSLGVLAQMQSDFPRACSLLTASLGVFRELGDRYLMQYPLYNLAAVTFSLEDYEQSLTYYTESLTVSREIKVPVQAALCIEGLANIAAKNHQWHRAVRLWGAAKKLRDIYELVIISPDQTRHDALVSTATAHLGAEAYARNFEEGALLSEDEAVDMALTPPPSTSAAAAQQL